MSANGRLRGPDLARIPGTSSRAAGRPLLRKDAAIAYRALDDYALRRWGVSMALHEGEIRRAYREYEAQVKARAYWCAQGKCGNAAVPGTSNHGLGINVDLMTQQQRWVVDQVGHLFGFSKAWSDAPWEWWHITFRPGSYPLVDAYRRRGAFKVLRRGMNGKRVRTLQTRLRRRGHDLPKPGEKFYGHFGKATEDAVKAFQRNHNLHPDGVVGLKTWRKLAKPKKEK
jgi:hypothetical protein